MITEDAVKAKLAELGPLDDADAVLGAALPALRSQTESGDWFAIKTARKDTLANPAKSATLDKALSAAFGDGGDDEAQASTGLEALARAIAAARGEGDDAVELGGDQYDLKLHAPKRGGRSTLRLRNPSAAPAEGEAEEASETES